METTEIKGGSEQLQNMKITQTKEVNDMLTSNLTEEELRKIEESIDRTEIDKELENVNFQHDPN